MPFIAYAGVKLKMDYTFYEKDKWYPLKTIHNVECRWRFTTGSRYEVICGVFATQECAETIAKYMFTTVLFNLLINNIPIDDECCRFWGDEFNLDGLEERYRKCINNTFYYSGTNQVYIQTNLFVIPVAKTIDDFSGLPLATREGSISNDGDVLSFNNYNISYFKFNKEGQQLYHTIIMADNTDNLGIRMTLYCGILEHLVNDYEKDQAVIQEIDKLMQHVEDSDLSKEEKHSLKEYLKNGKKASSRQKCRDFVKKYGREKYGKYTSNQIINAAYDIRSTFSHGSSCDNMYGTPAYYMKSVVLEVINNYMHEKDVKPVLS